MRRLHTAISAKRCRDDSNRRAVSDQPISAVAANTASCRARYATSDVPARPNTNAVKTSTEISAPRLRLPRKPRRMVNNPVSAVTQSSGAPSQKGAGSCHVPKTPRSSQPSRQRPNDKVSSARITPDPIRSPLRIQASITGPGPQEREAAPGLRVPLLSIFARRPPRPLRAASAPG